MLLSRQTTLNPAAFRQRLETKGTCGRMCLNPALAQCVKYRQSARRCRQVPMFVGPMAWTDVSLETVIFLFLDQVSRLVLLAVRLELLATPPTFSPG